MVRRLKVAVAYVRRSLSAAAGVFVSAPFWYLALVSVGVGSLSVGVGVQFGRGYGLIALGTMCVCGSELIRNGMTPRG